MHHRVEAAERLGAVELLVTWQRAKLHVRWSPLQRQRELAAKPAAMTTIMVLPMAAHRFRGRDDAGQRRGAPLRIVSTWWRQDRRTIRRDWGTALITSWRARNEGRS